VNKNTEMRKSIFLISCLSIFSVLNSQNQWKTTLTEPYYEVDDIAILSNNRSYISLNKTHEIFESRDSGASWKAIGPFETKYTYLSYKSLEVIDDKLSVLHYPRNGTTVLYNLGSDGSLVKQKVGKSLVKNYIKTDNEGNLFHVEFNYIYPVNSNFEVDRNPILTASNIFQSFLYNTDNNYVVLRNSSGKDTFRVVKFNSKSGEYLLHSIFFEDISPEDIVVTENGSIVFHSRSNKLFYAPFNKPSEYHEVPIPFNGKPDVVTIQATVSGEIFISTYEGIYKTDGVHLDQWDKCYQMSQDLPVPEADDVNNYYCFKDSTSAIISYGTICGASRVYCFSPKFKQWKEVKLDINLENIIDLKADKEGRLYGFRPCDYYLKTRYVISEDQGKTWQYLKISGYDVHGLAINKEGNAVAIILNKEVFIHNPLTNAWDNILTSNVIKPNVEIYHCYSIGQDLILDGLVGGAFPQKPLFYYSEDAGRTWQTTTTPVTQIDKFYPSMETLVDQEGHWLIYNGYYNNGLGLPFGVKISYDKGKSWNEDTRFGKLTEINEIVQLKDGKFIVSSRSNLPKFNNEYKLFIVDHTGNIEAISPDSIKKSYSLRSVTDRSLIGYSESLSGLDQPVLLISEVDSTYRNDYSFTGLGHSPYDSWLIKSAAVGKNNQIFLSLAMDGIYTNTADLFNHVNDQKTDKNPTLLNNISADMLVLKEIDGNAYNPYDYCIINGLGSVVSKGKILSGGVISISDLIPGVYHIMIFDYNHYSNYFKFLKI